MRAEEFLNDFSQWRDRVDGKPTGDVGEARLLLELMRDYLGIDDPGELVPGNLEELLLDLYPRKVVTQKQEDVAETIPTIRALLAFLADTKRLPAKKVQRLEREVGGIEGRFIDAVMDPAGWGPGRSIAQGMIADGVDLSDEAAIERWRQNYNAGQEPRRPDIQLGALDPREALGLPERMPPIRLQAESELAAAARTSRALSRVRELVLWIGDGRDLDPSSGGLTGPDTVTAAEALGIPVPMKQAEAQAVLPLMPPAPAVRRMRDIPELCRLWDIALTLDFLNSTDHQVWAADRLEDWPDGDDEDVLEIWETSLGEVISAVASDADLQSHSRLALDGVGAPVAIMLFLAGGTGLPMGEASERVRDLATSHLAPSAARKAWQSWLKTHGDPARTLLARLEELGAVDFDGDDARLTPLGLWAVRNQLGQFGVDVPVFPLVEEMTAADLAAVAEVSSPEELAEEIAAWLELRGPEDAVRELLDAARSGTPATRVIATSIATDLGAVAEPDWREALTQLELRPYAKIALTRLGGVEPPQTLPGLEVERADLGWLAIDVLAATDPDKPEEMVERLRRAIPPGQEQDVFEAMWRLPHPSAYDVLSMIGAHHSDKKIAKAARRAAFKAASRNS
ncbi:hypothetical protein [Actinopolymorpha alba]|uniref:hypothetical protein n=1 Tax=Actinopolymorpha alba TaxID=533267 RepID=UPI00037B045D|nr:hypothetical protein [Actinopolymorpha alba]